MGVPGQFVQAKNHHAGASRETRHLMPLRLRKLIGMIGLIVFIGIYVLIVLSVASARFADAPWWSHLLFFAVGGLLWVPPAMAIIKWMERPIDDNRR